MAQFRAKCRRRCLVSGCQRAAAWEPLVVVWVRACAATHLLRGYKAGVGRGGGSHPYPGAVGNRVPVGVRVDGVPSACTVGCARYQLHVRSWNSQ